MKSINNLEDLRYRKLLLRSEIRLKEQKMGKRFDALKIELNTANFKNEMVRSAMSNPTLVINLARISYDLIMRIRRYKRKRKQGKKLKQGK
jgi:hypothetical protein